MIMELKDFFYRNKKLALAFSGGMNSSFLLYMAKYYGVEIVAYLLRTGFQPLHKIEEAINFAMLADVELKIIDDDILQNEKIKANKLDRCYHCRHHLFSILKSKANSDGFEIVIEGSCGIQNSSIEALSELDIKSPLKICNLAKSDIKKSLKDFNLNIWDKSPYSCLADRISHCDIITDKKLRDIENAENFLNTLGFEDFFVLSEGNAAKILLKDNDFDRFIMNRNLIKKHLDMFGDIVLDIEPIK